MGELCGEVGSRDVRLISDSYLGNDKRIYDACDLNPGSGYVGESRFGLTKADADHVAGTNIPKQLGGAM
jgi:hypothetical protein